jgi:hypothetical protein
MMLASLLLATAASTTPPLQGDLPLRAGTDSSQLARIADSLLQPWRENGHLLASIHVEAQAPRIEYHIQPGPFFQWRAVRSYGDSIYTPNALVRRSGLTAGRPAAPSQLEAAAKNLTQDGCAEIAGEPQPRGVPGTGWADAWIPLRRVPCSQAQAALGWDQQGGFQGYVEAKLANLLGTARQANLSASSYPEATRFDFLWKEPWIGSWNVGLDLQLELQETKLEQMRRAMIQARWPWEYGNWIVGIETWTDIVTSDSSDSAPATKVSAVGSRFGWEHSPHDAGWLSPFFSGSLLATSLQTFQDSRHLLLRSEASLRLRRPLTSWSAAQVRLSARSLWPLDSSSALGETRSLGGAGSWKGHQEGQFLSPQWIWGEAELRAGAPDWGCALFAAPGLVWKRAEGGYASHSGWGAGVGFFWSRAGNDVRLDLAGGEGTRSWDEAYLHLVLSNRF